MSLAKNIKALATGLRITGNYLLKKPVTLFYPFEKQEIFDGYRGFYSLRGMFGEVKQAKAFPEMPPCQNTCPAHVDPRGYNRLIMEGKYIEAWELVRERAPFPAVLGRICHHPCETKCRRGYYDESVAIRSLKRYLADKALPVVKKKRKKKNPPDGLRVAVIGAGPAGLTAALELVRKGYQATVFEKSNLPGGMLMYGVPMYRLPEDILLAEVEEIEKDGVEIITGVEFGTEVSFSDLRKQGYKAFLLAVGLQAGRTLPIPGHDLPNVLSAVPFLRAVNSGEKPEIGKEIIVIGGGNVAVDVARCAVRLGAKKVRMVCLEKFEEMPAFSWEIEEALEEEIEINCSWGPKAIISENGKIKGLEVIQCTAVFDEQRRFNPQFCETVTNFIPGDTVIFSIGQASDLSFLKDTEVEVDEKGRLKIDLATLQTNVPDVFACGEIVTGPSTCIGSIAHAHEAVISIDRYLQGKDLIKGRPKLHLVEYQDYPSLPKEIFEKERLRPEMPVLSPEKRKTNFNQIELGFTDQEAKKEAYRCLQCLSGNCTGCSFCARVCPALAIQVERKEDWGAKNYQVDLSLCIYCGFCEEQCPTKAIKLTKEFEKAAEDRKEFVFEKKELFRGVKE